nr:hypothetical protein [Tanacetum cinerariifolium]
MTTVGCDGDVAAVGCCVSGGECSQNRRDLHRNTPLDRVEVLDKESWGDNNEEDYDDDKFEDDADNNDDDSDDNSGSEDHDDDSDDERTEFDSYEIPDPNKVEQINKILLNSHDLSKKRKMLIPSPTDTMIASLMDTIVHNEITSATTIPPPPPLFNPLQQEATPTPTETTSEATTSFTSHPDFTSVFKFNERVTNLEKDLLEIKQVDQEEAQAKKREYIELVDSTVRSIIKEEVNTQLPQILQQAISEGVATPVIEKNVTESLEISQVVRVEEPPTSFNEINDTFDFSEFVMNRLKILNLAQAILVGPAFNLLKGDFKRLRLQDIKDMLLLLVQLKLTNLTIDERSNLRKNTVYTSYSDPHGIIYVDQYKRKRLMRADELHKFCDGTLNDFWTALHDITARIRMEYMPMRKWSNLDKKRARVMVQDIDKQLYQRRLMRNLQKFVGGRVYGNDLRLLERTI